MGVPELLILINYVSGVSTGGAVSNVERVVKTSRNIIGVNVHQHSGIAAFHLRNSHWGCDQLNLRVNWSQKGDHVSWRLELFWILLKVLILIKE